MAAPESPAPQAAENFPDCHGTVPSTTAYGWLSPRISFSTDFGVITGKDSPRREEASSARVEWSTEFEFSLSIECPGGSPADDIFYEGKLLPLQLLPSSRSPILLVKELLEEESGGSSRDRSCASSVCASPLIVKSASFPPGSPTVVLPDGETLGRGFHDTGSKGKSYYPGLHALKLVTLFFRRQLGRTPPPRPPPVPLPSGDGNSAQPGDTTSCVSAGAELTRSSSSSSSGNSQRRSKSSNSGRILWMNLERCSRKNADQSRNKRRRRPNPGDKGSSSSSGSAGSFSSSVRVAPVLNVPMCMGPVRETKSTLAGLRKLFHGRKAGLQRVTWACPGGAV